MGAGFATDGSVLGFVAAPVAIMCYQISYVLKRIQQSSLPQAGPQEVYCLCANILTKHNLHQLSLAELEFQFVQQDFSHGRRYDVLRCQCMLGTQQDEAD